MFEPGTRDLGGERGWSRHRDGVTGDDARARERDEGTEVPRPSCGGEENSHLYIVAPAVRGRQHLNTSVAVEPATMGARFTLMRTWL